MSSMSNLVHTIKNSSGPLNTSLKNLKTFNEVMIHIKLTYLNGNVGIKTLFKMGSLSEKSGLDTGACLKNIETFLTMAEVVMNHGLSKYVCNEDIIKLAEIMLLSKDLTSLEKFSSNRNPSRTEGIDSLSETVIQWQMILKGIHHHLWQLGGIWKILFV